MSGVSAKTVTNVCICRVSITHYVSNQWRIKGDEPVDITTDIKSAVGNVAISTGSSPLIAYMMCDRDTADIDIDTVLPNISLMNNRLAHTCPSHNSPVCISFSFSSFDNESFVENSLAT